MGRHEDYAHRYPSCGFGGRCDDWARARRREGEETERRMHEAIELHIEGLIQGRQPVPPSTSFAEWVLVRAQLFRFRRSRQSGQPARLMRRGAAFLLPAVDGVFHSPDRQEHRRWRRTGVRRSLQRFDRKESVFGVEGDGVWLGVNDDPDAPVVVRHSERELEHEAEELEAEPLSLR